MVATVLSVANATKRFGGLVAVNNLSFEVNRNEVMGIIGPNGSGKTTMMNLISGDLRMSEGSISLEGRFISALKANQINRRGISRTFQMVRVLPGLSVAENCIAGMAFGPRRMWGDEARYEAGRLLERVGLAKHEALPVGSLTYIDQKRLELARALAADPKLLLLDEPTASLDQQNRATVLELIREAKTNGAAIIGIFHDAAAREAVCDREIDVGAFRPSVSACTVNEHQ